MTTVYYNIASHPEEGEYLSSSSNGTHSHTVDVGSLNTWLVNNIPSNAVIRSVFYEITCHYTTSIGSADVNLSLYYGTGGNSGTNIGNKGSIPKNTATPYSWDISSYFNSTSPFNMSTVQPKLSVCFTTSSFWGGYVYCSNARIAISYDIVETVCDINFDNLLSFSAWANSPSSSVAPGCNGTITTDKTSGTVTSQGSGDFYTLYYTGDSSLYYIPVQAGQQYLFRFDADIIGGVQAYVFYFNDSYATVNNASGVYFDGIYGSNNLYFTPPSGCTKVTFRIGTTNGSRVVFSNLAIYKTSLNTHEITNRQYRKVFERGSVIGILYEPERPGYVFQGWYTGENGTGQHIRMIDTLSANTTVYSHWVKRAYYDVNYDNLFSFADWAYSPSGRPQGLSDSAYIGTISTDIPNGTVTVKGADPNGSAFYTMYGAFSPYHHIPVVAGQQYAFRYNVSQTYNMQAFVFFCNDNQDFVTDPSTGLQFVFDTNGNDLVFVPPSGCTNVCFRLGVGGINTAVFSNIGLYKVTDEQGITNRPIRKNIPYGSAVGTLSTPSKEGYTFKGWYTGESGSGAEIKSSDSFIKGVTAYSAWTKLHTVTFKDENGATLKTEAVADGSTTTPPSNPTKADTAQWDYTFDGWYDAIGNKWTSDTVITSDTVFTARYTAVVQKYTITASGTNGTVTGGGTYDYNSNVTLTATPNSGYKFKQWSDGVTSATRTVTVTGAATYTAVFELIPPEIKLVQMIYLDKQISATNKVPCGEGFIISVELS